jgi:spermidine synthase
MKRPSLRPGQPAGLTLVCYTVAFFSGMCVMAVEISASRVLAPFFGTTAFVWTNVIGCVMVALAAGYVVGGRLADRRPDLRILLRWLAAAALFLMAMPFVAPSMVGVIADALRGSGSAFTFIFWGSLAAIALLFSPPIFVLGMTAPFLVRVLAADHPVGDAAGRVFGISTLGSILGTFLPTLVFIPALGTGRTIVLFAVLLLVVVVAALANWRLMVAALFSAGLLAIPLPTARGAAGRIFSTESAYQFIEVREDPTFRYLAYNDASGFQTVARKGAWLTGFYFDYYSLVPFLLDRPAERVLLVGLGGGTIANQIHHYHPATAIDGVEIDRQVIAIARDFFDLDPSIRVVNQDGRVFVARADQRYDVVIVDAYAHQVYIPFHLVTGEFFRQVRRVLSPGGILAINVAAARDDSPLLRGVLNTLAGEFGHVARFRIGGTPSNVVLASPAPFAMARLERAAGTPLHELARHAAARMQSVRFDPRGVRLTDDWAPIERMVDWELLGPPLR